VAVGPLSDAAVGASTFRPATNDDLAACAAIWRTSINDYTNRLNLPEIPDDLAAVLRLYAHLRSTDPDGFIVAEQVNGTGAARIVAFVSSVRRGPLWFLSMLFVLPEMQGKGLGRALLERVMPPAGSASLATCTDSVQPISNALYASLGMVPRTPRLRLVGLPDRRGELAPLPDGIRAVPFEEIHDGAADGLKASALDDELDALDREVIGFTHRQDHDMVRREGRIGFLFVGAGGTTIGYGYASQAGRVGPVAVRDADLLDPILGHIVTTVAPRGAFGVWLPGAAVTATTTLLRAGFRVDGFPVLLCWDKPLTDFSRYVPISPGLL
jgi:GNAT superfamily N-acetyltransferase